MKLTEHFSLSEFTRSSTAARLNIRNIPEARHIENLRNLCKHVLEPLRTAMGVPIHISSGYRCTALNRAVGGVSDSQHLTGEAADIRLPSTAIGRKWFLWMMDNLPFDQLIWERQGSTHWIHVSCRHDLSQNRQTVLRVRKK